MDANKGGVGETRQALRATVTPNTGLIKNPKAREGFNNALGVIGLVLGTVMVVDITSNNFDLTAWTEPIFVGYTYVAAAFGLTVTRPNYPKL